MQKEYGKVRSSSLDFTVVLLSEGDSLIPIPHVLPRRRDYVNSILDFYLGTIQFKSEVLRTS